MDIDIFKDILVPVIGGLGIFMLGLEFMANGIQALSVNRMRAFLAKAAGTPIKGVLAGTLITGVIQSSTAMSVMVVGLVNAGVIALRPAISVIMGANIGTTLGNGLIALPLGPLGLILAGLFSLVYCFAKSEKIKQHSARLYGLRADFLRPQPDDRRPAPAAEPARSHGADCRPCKANSYRQPFEVRADRRRRDRDDPLVVGDDRHRDGSWCGRHSRLDHRRRLLARRRSRHHDHLVDGLSQSFEERQADGLRAYIVQHHRRVHHASRCSSSPSRSWGGPCSCFGGDPAIPVIVDGKETFPLVPVAVGLYSTFFNVFNTLLLFPFIGVFERVLSRVGRTDAEDVEDYSTPKFLDRKLASDFAKAIPAVQQETARHLQAGAMFLDIARSSKKAPSDPGEHYLATDILSRDIRAYTASLMKEDLPYEQLDLIASLIEEADFTAASDGIDASGGASRAAREVQQPGSGDRRRGLEQAGCVAARDIAGLWHCRPENARGPCQSPRGRGTAQPHAGARARMLARPNAARSWLCWVRSSGRRSSSTASTPSANPSTARACLPALQLARKSNRARWAMQA